MSLLSKVMETVAKVVPDKEDELIGDSKHIGKSIDRLDGKLKVTGAAQFSAEYPLKGLTHASLVYSNVAKGRITDIDIRAAEKQVGVIRIITHRNAPKLNPPPNFDPSGGTDAGGSTVNMFNTDRIYWNGQAVAIVVADTIDRAEHAASLVRVTYAEEEAALSFQAEKPNAKPPKNILGDDTTVKHGDAESALQVAAARVDHVYETPRYNHNAIELHATTAEWRDDRLTLWDASQFIRGVADTIAKIFSIDSASVRVLSPFVGGGFGGKGSVWASHLCALAAKETGRPVKLVLPREGVYRLVGGRTLSEQRVALGADAEGNLTALVHTGTTAESPTNEFPEQFSFPARHLYRTENLYVTQDVVKLNSTPNTFMRAPGESIGTFALESAMDELAYELRMDPVELRLKNEPDRDPAKGTEFSSRHLAQAYALGAEKFGWANRPLHARATRNGDWLTGQGVATATYPVYRLKTLARVRINADGTAVVQTSAQEMGMGTATAQTQAAAERFGLPMEKVRFEYGDTDFPAANQAGGSSQTVSIANAVMVAFDKAKGELLSLAKDNESSPLAKSDIDDVEARNGGLFRRDDGSAGQTYVDILRHAGRDCVEVEAKSTPPLESLKYSMHSYGAQFCELRVNDRTGEVRLNRWVGVFDAGRIINPKMAHSQLKGGIIMGIGMALTEETFFDERNGRIMNPSLAEYHVPVNADIPDIETHYLDIPDPLTPLGARGIGEIGITGVAAAIANAVYHATGKRIRDLPITLDKLL